MMENIHYCKLIHMWNNTVEPVYSCLTDAISASMVQYNYEK